MIPVSKDTVALVVSPQDKDWKIICVTEYKKNGEWIYGLNLITSLEDVMQCAWDNKLNIIPENVIIQI